MGAGRSAEDGAPEGRGACATRRARSESAAGRPRAGAAAAAFSKKRRRLGMEMIVGVSCYATENKDRCNFLSLAAAETECYGRGWTKIPARGRRLRMR